MKDGNNDRTESNIEIQSANTVHSLRQQLRDLKNSRNRKANEEKAASSTNAVSIATQPIQVSVQNENNHPNNGVHNHTPFSNVATSSAKVISSDAVIANEALLVLPELLSLSPQERLSYVGFEGINKRIRLDKRIKAQNELKVHNTSAYLHRQVCLSQNKRTTFLSLHLCNFTQTMLELDNRLPTDDERQLASTIGCPDGMAVCYQPSSGMTNSFFGGRWYPSLQGGLHASGSTISMEDMNWEVAADQKALVELLIKERRIKGHKSLDEPLTCRILSCGFRNTVVKRIAIITDKNGMSIIVNVDMFVKAGITKMNIGNQGVRGELTANGNILKIYYRHGVLYESDTNTEIFKDSLEGKQLLPYLRSIHERIAGPQIEPQRLTWGTLNNSIGDPYPFPTSNLKYKVVDEELPADEIGETNNNTAEALSRYHRLLAEHLDAQSSDPTEQRITVTGQTRGGTVALAKMTGDLIQHFDLEVVKEGSDTFHEFTCKWCKKGKESEPYKQRRLYTAKCKPGVTLFKSTYARAHFTGKGGDSRCTPGSSWSNPRKCKYIPASIDLGVKKKKKSTGKRKRKGA